MNCKEFHHWLSSRDIRQAILPGEAAAHMAECRACERLFHGDSRLEDAIRRGMQMEELPRGLADQVSASLDRQRISNPSRRAGAALSACLLLLLAAVYFHFTEKSEGFKDLNQIGIHAVRGHLAGNPKMDFTAGEVDQALAAMTEALGFQVLLPDLDRSTLLGGRLCVLGDCRAACFALDRNGKPGSLYIMAPQDLYTADGSRFTTRIRGCRATVWKENGQIYATVF